MVLILPLLMHQVLGVLHRVAMLKSEILYKYVDVSGIMLVT